MSLGTFLHLFGPIMLATKAFGTRSVRDVIFSTRLPRPYSGHHTRFSHLFLTLFLAVLCSPNQSEPYRTGPHGPVHGSVRSTAVTVSPVLGPLKRPEDRTGPDHGHPSPSSASPQAILSAATRYTDGSPSRWSAVTGTLSPPHSVPAFGPTSGSL